ncbi:TerB family tellurite resistance protein [Psychromonas sp. 14N.309.X.WAT.B.A12]|uniref:tellurite resistance TerB family protein n=1 Tax=unclassified Psychromonas TaxID=2614957 RepID=UPI0025AF5561|nr:TerB family tellurite resistance protein [Psychromonas sp. 14N.309.X.WAT.B.A12]MDN2663011.1 TerB family tellurite resistance protein [Psychromonas sp. 14N.309.X.WAT.B.A12]
MIAKIKQFLNSMIPPDSPEFDKSLAIVCLLCEVCVADHQSASEEETAVVHTLQKLLNIDANNASRLLQEGMKEVSASNSVFDFTSQLGELDSDARIDVIKAMWEIAYADGHLDEMEEALIRKVASLLYVNHSDFIKTKLSVVPAH